MKVGIVCPYDLSIPGGVQNVVLETHKRLLARGHKSVVISVGPEKRVSIPKSVFFGKALPVEFNGAMASVNFGSWATDKQVFSYLRQEKLDVVCVHEPLIPFLNWEVINFPRLVKVGWFHSTSFVDVLQFPMGLVTEPVQNLLAAGLDGKIAASPTARYVWRQVFSKGGEVISAGVDVERFANATAADLGGKTRIKVLFVGRLDMRKGVLEVLKAFGEVVKSVDAELWIVGDGPQLPEAWELIKDLKLGGRIRLVGRVSDGELPGYFKAADIYAAPSLGGESVGLVLLEAMAAGVPVVAYANVGYKYTLTGTPWPGQVVPIKSHKKMAQSMIELAKSVELRQRVADWQREKVKEFDWEVVTDKFENYLKKIYAGATRN
jgi:phosphatidyl-myo-inositol alpha-mannosyltransferase